jgi:ATP adenylyltransferase
MPGQDSFLTSFLPTKYSKTIPRDLGRAGLLPGGMTKRLPGKKIEVRISLFRCCSVSPDHILGYMAGNILWAPWRAAFILGKKEKGCVFCNRHRMKDSVKSLIVFRGEHNFVILNKYPYNTGHTLVVPNRHVGLLEKLTEAEATEFFELTRKTVTVLKRTLKPHAINVGMNLGRMSGAGVPGHVHMHIVPRWNGDTNFMPVLGRTSVVSIPLEPVWKAMRREFSSL